MEHNFSHQVRNTVPVRKLMRVYYRLCRSLEKKSLWLRLPLLEAGLYAYTSYSGGVYLTLRVGRHGRKEHAFDVLFLWQMDWSGWSPGHLTAKLSVGFSRWGVIMSHWQKGMTTEERRQIRAERDVPFAPYVPSL